MRAVIVELHRSDWVPSPRQVIRFEHEGRTYYVTPETAPGGRRAFLHEKGLEAGLVLGEVELPDAAAAQFINEADFARLLGVQEVPDPPPPQLAKDRGLLAAD